MEIVYGHADNVIGHADVINARYCEERNASEIAETH